MAPEFTFAFWLQLVDGVEQTLAEAADDTGDWATAERVRRDAVARADEGLPAGHPERAACRVVLADFLIRSERHPEAEAELEAADRILAEHPAARGRAMGRRRAEVEDGLIRVAERLGDAAAAERWRVVRAALAGDGPPAVAPPPRPVHR